MSRVDTTEKVRASPSKVWTWFRPERMKEWYGPELELLSPGPLGKGSRVRISGRSGARRLGYEATVTEYAENRSLAWEGADERAAYRVAFLISPRDGGTVVFLRDEFRLRGLLGRLYEKLFLIGRVAKYDRHFLSQLKRLVEGKG